MIVPKSGYLKSQLTRNQGIGICNPSYPEMIIRKSDRQDILFEAFFDTRYAAITGEFVARFFGIQILP